MNDRDLFKEFLKFNNLYDTFEIRMDQCMFSNYEY